MVQAMDDYWRDHPPLHLMVAAYLDVKPSGANDTRGQDLHEIAEFGIPVGELPASEFDAVLASHGLPIE